MKDLAKVSEQERDDFFKAFDYVLCDVDGVLKSLNNDIAGARNGIKSLQNLGKKVIFVSNNNTKPHDLYYSQLKSSGYDLAQSDLVIPVLAMADFLKKRDFSKEIFLIGMTSIRNHLQEAGFTIETFHHENPEESVPKFLKECISINPKVGAVIADIDINMEVAQLQRAATYLKNPDVLFITGGSDKQLYFGEGRVLIGPGSFHAILEDMSGRKPHRLAKPSPELNEFIVGKFGIRDPGRVLFVGDSIPEDMGFASGCGYKKLLVFSGLTKREEVEKWAFPEEYKPDYYAESLEVVYDIISRRGGVERAESAQ